MRLPYLPPDKCINHPTLKAVRKHLCSQCYTKWEKTVMDYELWQEEKKYIQDEFAHYGGSKEDE